MRDLLPIIIGGGGFVGIGGVLATLFLLRSQRDVNLADAAGRLVNASDTFTTNVVEDLASARSEVRQARNEIAVLTEQVSELTKTVGRMEEQIERANEERDAARRETAEVRMKLEECYATIAGRRRDDPRSR